MNMYILRLIFTSLIISVFCSSCSNNNSLSVGFKNIGGEDIFVFPSKMGKYTIGAGLLLYDKEKSTHLYFTGKFKWPETVIVKWEKSDKSIVTKTVKVKGKIPKEFKQNRDEIIFNIFPDNTVKLSFEIEVGKYNWKEIDSNGKEVDYGKKGKS